MTKGLKLVFLFFFMFGVNNANRVKKMYIMLFFLEKKLSL